MRRRRESKPADPPADPAVRARELRARAAKVRRSGTAQARDAAERVKTETAAIEAEAAELEREAELAAARKELLAEAAGVEAKAKELRATAAELESQIEEARARGELLDRRIEELPTEAAAIEAAIAEALGSVDTVRLVDLEARRSALEPVRGRLSTEVDRALEQLAGLQMRREDLAHEAALEETLAASLRAQAEDDPLGDAPDDPEAAQEQRLADQLAERRRQDELRRRMRPPWMQAAEAADQRERDAESAKWARRFGPAGR